MTIGSLTYDDEEKAYELVMILPDKNCTEFVIYCSVLDDGGCCLQFDRSRIKEINDDGECQIDFTF